jgi:lipopolysaccharide transport system ATP-binding protein
MGNTIIICVENLGKCYRINHKQSERYATLRDVIAEKFAASWQRLRGRSQASDLRHLTSGSAQNSDIRPLIYARNSHEDFWALKDVSFEIKRGEVVGIIGRNGAGKSTLLKILSRITELTEGRVRIKGRVASLLEVGTGFHPELTGRENIFLNGAILGMTRAEIKRKFDTIVAFAEVEKFLDTPVKRYSSGMYVRLAFAVAAHLEPEILIVDEVLAVGDAVFQKKCLGKMGEVAQGGRTVLFVSHNMNAVETLCNRALLLEKGQMVEEGGEVRKVIARYLSGSAGNEVVTSAWVNKNNALNHDSIQPLYFAVVNEQGQPLSAPVRNDQPLFVIIRADVRQLDPALNAGFALFNQDSELLLWSLTTDGPEERWPKLECGDVEFRCALPTRFLNEGSYRLELIASLHFRDFLVRPGHNSPAVHFEIQGGLSDSPYWMRARPGLLAPELVWERVS